MTQAFPLQWPAGWKRTMPIARKPAKFKEGSRQYSQNPGGGSWMNYKRLSIADATQRVLNELERHPDRPGGSHERMAEISRARDEGLQERNGQ